MIDRVGVVIPVSNEEVDLRACLESVRASRDQLHARRGIEVQLVAVLDACTDQSAAIASEFDDVVALAIDRARVGAARHAGCSHVLSGSVRPHATFLVNTDADSTVRPDWLCVMVALADSGADVVLGTVQPDVNLSHPLRDAWNARYRPVDGHPHIHGANFGVRGDVYARLGGWPDLATAEDHRLAALARLTPDVRIVATGQVPVWTSMRLAGRAPSGFADYLRELDESSGPMGSLA